MKLQLHDKNFIPFMPLFLIFCYWFYLSIWCGFLLSKIVDDFFDNTVNQKSLSKCIEYRENFNFKNIIKNTIKTIID